MMKAAVRSDNRQDYRLKFAVKAWKSESPAAVRGSIGKDGFIGRYHGEHEPEMGQAAGHHEQVEELVGGKHPGPEDGPVQEVEHRPHAIKNSTKKG